MSAAGNCGGAQPIFDLVLQHSKDRRPIGEFQAIGHRLADMQTKLQAARVLTWRAALNVGQGIDALAEITMAKLFSPVQLGGLRLENRIAVAPMGQNRGVGGLVSPWHL